MGPEVEIFTFCQKGHFFVVMNRVVASEFQRVKRERDTLQERCDALQAMVGSLQVQLELYAEVMHGKYERTKVRKRRKHVPRSK